MTDIDPVLVQRIERFIKALPPAVRRNFLPRVLQRRADEPHWEKMAPRDIALRLLYPAPQTGARGADCVPAVAAAAAAPPPAAAAAPAESIKSKLLRTGGERLTTLSAAVSAEAPHTGEDLHRLVIQRACVVLEQAAQNGEVVELITPGFASGTHWAPVGRAGTAGSAAYSRYKNKYNKRNYKTLIPLFYDERPCTSKQIWQQRKDAAGAVEKALHRHFADNAHYRGSEGGGEPAYSNTTHFYVYLAIKCT
jgi:hypothetical protein